MSPLSRGEEEVLLACGEAAFNSGTFTEGDINWRIRDRFTGRELDSLVRGGYLQDWTPPLPFDRPSTSFEPQPAKQYKLLVKGELLIRELRLS